MVWVRIRFLPKDSALAISENGGAEPWSLEHYLLSDLWALQAKKMSPKKAPDQHPWRAELSKRANANRTESRRAALNRARARHKSSKTT